MRAWVDHEKNRLCLAGETELEKTMLDRVQDEICALGGTVTVYDSTDTRFLYVPIRSRVSNPT